MIRTCPQCKKEYKTKLDRPENDDRNIQEIFPNAELWEREQLVLGLCSQVCWNDFIGLPQPSERTSK